jgi:hypothetical protein
VTTLEETFTFVLRKFTELRACRNPTNGSWNAERAKQSHQRQLVDVSDPVYEQRPTCKTIPPTAVGGYFRSDLNEPPTAVGGINNRIRRFSRNDLNEPPTAVGGIEMI